jgi:hypothetical protein
MNKFGKTFRLTIQSNDKPNEAIVIEPPFTVEFDVNRDMGAQANTGDFKVYNLGSQTKKRIFQDLFSLSVDRKVIFEAGYNGKLTTIFFGTLKKAYSSRVGTEIITELNCWDEGFGAFTTAFINKTYSAGWTQKDIIKAQMQSMTSANGLQMGEVGEFDTTQQPRGISLIGQGFAVLNKTTDGMVFIDNNKINALQNHEVIDSLVPVIDSSSGLLGTPKRQDAKLTVECIFEPGIIVGQVIEIDSDVQDEFNGQYKVIGLHHSGIMSETVAGDCRTELQMLMPNLLNNGQDMNLIRGDEVIPVVQKFKTNIRPEIDKLIYYWCSKYGVDQNLLKAIIRQESGLGHYRPDGTVKRSSAGAIGICQLMPATARTLGVNPYDLSENIHGGAKYLANVSAHYHGDKVKIIASYNAGQGAVDKYNGVPPYNETRHYTRVVLGNYYVFKGGKR